MEAHLESVRGSFVNDCKHVCTSSRVDLGSIAFAIFSMCICALNYRTNRAIVRHLPSELQSKGPLQEAVRSVECLLWPCALDLNARPCSEFSGLTNRAASSRWRSKTTSLRMRGLKSLSRAVEAFAFEAVLKHKFQSRISEQYLANSVSWLQAKP